MKGIGLLPPKGLSPSPIGGIPFPRPHQGKCTSLNIIMIFCTKCYIVYPKMRIFAVQKEE